jgi:hypothetical protein
MADTPLYATLISFGDPSGVGGSTVTFQPHHSYLNTKAERRNRQYTWLLGKADPIDLHGGGVAAKASPEATWTYYIVAPDGTTEAAGPGYVEGVYQAIKAQMLSTNSDGTTGELGTLRVYAGDGTTVRSYQAALVDCTPDDTDRGPFHIKLRLVFALYLEAV